MYNEKIEIITCPKCGGKGYFKPLFGSETNCTLCEGIGKIRWLPGEVSCGRCHGTGEIMEGMTGFEHSQCCPACNGRGRKRI